MDRLAVDLVDLDAVDEDRLRLGTVDREVDEGVGADATAQDAELVGVERDGGRFDAVAEDDGGEAPFAAKAGVGLPE